MEMVNELYQYKELPKEEQELAVVREALELLLLVLAPLHPMLPRSFGIA